MSLPTSRNTIYSAGTPIKSVDMNDMQDMIVGGRHGELELFFEIDAVAKDPNSSWVTGLYEWTNTAGGAGTYAWVPFSLPVGTAISEVGFYVEAISGSINFEVTLQTVVLPSNAAAVDVDTSGTVGVSSAAQLVSVTNSHVIAANKRYYARVEKQNASGTRAELHGFYLKYTK